MDICRSIQPSDLRLEKSDSQIVNIPIVKSFSRLKDWIFKWWLIIAGWIQIKFFQKAALEVGSNTDKVYVIFFKKRYKISGISVKNQTVWKNPERYIPVDRRYFYYIFMTHVDVNLWEKNSDGFMEFHHFMKKIDTDED